MEPVLPELVLIGTPSRSPLRSPSIAAFQAAVETLRHSDIGTCASAFAGRLWIPKPRSRSFELTVRRCEWRVSMIVVEILFIAGTRAFNEVVLRVIQRIANDMRAWELAQCSRTSRRLREPIELHAGSLGNPIGCVSNWARCRRTSSSGISSTGARS